MSIPIISGDDGDLGDVTASFDFIYQVSDDIDDTVNITFKIDFVTVDTYTNVIFDENLTLTIDIDNLKLSYHTMEIVATDNNNNTATRTYIFCKKDVYRIGNIDYIEINNCIADQIHLRELTSVIVDTTSTKETTWQADTRLLAKFQGDSEAGNINNEGNPINKIIFKRRKPGQIYNITIGSVDFDPTNVQSLNFVDYSQPVGSLIYSIVPVGSNRLEGRPNEISVESKFSGWWIIDENKNRQFGFNKQYGGEDRTVDIQLNQGRIEIETMSKYPVVYYDPTEYVRFNLSAVVVPSNYSITEWNNFISIITQHTPLIVKSGNGDFYIVDVCAPSKQVLLNKYVNGDPFVLNCSCVEIMSVEEYFGVENIPQMYFDKEVN